MKKPNGIGSFFLCFLINMVMTLEFSIPAWVLLVFHFWKGLSLVWFWIALGAWVVIILFWMLVMSWAGKCSTPTPTRENKNPYSVGNRPEDKKD